MCVKYDKKSSKKGKDFHHKSFVIGTRPVLCVYVTESCYKLE